MASPAADPALPGFGEIAVAMLPFALSRSPWFGLGARWCPGRSGAAIYQTVSGGACCATTTSHDFAVTGAATGISPGPGPISQGLGWSKAVLLPWDSERRTELRQRTDDSTDRNRPFCLVQRLIDFSIDPEAVQ